MSDSSESLYGVSPSDKSVMQAILYKKNRPKSARNSGYGSQEYLHTLHQEPNTAAKTQFIMGIGQLPVYSSSYVNNLREFKQVQVWKTYDIFQYFQKNFCKTAKRIMAATYLAVWKDWYNIYR